jgi:subtilisin family serine protease
MQNPITSILAVITLLLIFGVLTEARLLAILHNDASWPHDLANAERFVLPSRAGRELRGLILESNEDLASARENPSVAHVEWDRPIFTRRPLEPRQRVRPAPPATSGPLSWALDRLDGDIDGHYVYPGSAGSGITVFVLDSGITPNLSEFGGRAVEGPNFTNETANGDEKGHGTFVAAIVAGSNYGVAKRSKVVGVKVIRKDGFGRISDIVRGLVWTVNATANGTAFPSIISLSVGSKQSMILDQALNYIVDLGIPVRSNSSRNICRSR